MEETQDSLTVRINYSSSGNTRKPEQQTRRGFHGRGTQSRRRGRGRTPVADSRSRQRESAAGETTNFSDRGADFRRSSDVRDNRRFDEEEPFWAERGARQSRGRWRGAGWRRGGAGRYFRGRPEATSDPRSGHTELAELNGDVSPTAALREQISQSMHAENAASMDAVGEHLKNVNIRGMQPVNRRARSRPYIVRRSSAGRYSRASFADRATTRDAGLPQPSVSEVRTSTVPCSGLNDRMMEDWDAECVQVETTDTDTGTLRTETATDMTQAHTVVNSNSIEGELGIDVNQVHATS